MSDELIKEMPEEHDHEEHEHDHESHEHHHHHDHGECCHHDYDDHDHEHDLTPVDFDGEILYPEPIKADDILIDILVDMVNEKL